MMLKVWFIFTQRCALWENAMLPVMLLQTLVMLLNINYIYIISNYLYPGYNIKKIQKIPKKIIRYV